METIKLSNKPLVCSLDLGSTKVVIMVAEAVNDSLKVLGKGVAFHRGVKQGSIISIQETSEAIRKAKKEAELSSGHEIKEVYVSFGGLNVKSFNSTGLAAVQGGQVSQDDIDRALETAQAVLLPEDREIVHVLPKEFILDGLGEIFDPTGMQGVRLETKVHLITGTRTFFPNILKCVEDSGLKVKEFVLQSFASAEATLSEEEKELGVCLVEVGGGTSDWIIYKKGSVVATGSVGVGGSNFTYDLSIGLKTSFYNAEKVKVEFGSCKPSMNEEPAVIEYEEVGTKAIKNTTINEVADILGARAQETVQLIVEDIKDSGFYNELAAGVVFTGGGSQLAGFIKEDGEHIDGIILRKAKPKMPTLANESLEDATFVCSVGLLRYGRKKIRQQKKEKIKFRGATSAMTRNNKVAGSVEEPFKSFGKQFKDFIGL